MLFFVFVGFNVSYEAEGRTQALPHEAGTLAAGLLYRALQRYAGIALPRLLCPGRLRDVLDRRYRKLIKKKVQKSSKRMSGSLFRHRQGSFTPLACSLNGPGLYACSFPSQ